MEYHGNLKTFLKNQEIILTFKNILKLWKYIENQNYYETKEALMEAMNLHPKKRTKKNAKIPKTFLSFVPVAGKICEWALKP